MGWQEEGTHLDSYFFLNEALDTSKLRLVVRAEQIFEPICQCCDTEVNGYSQAYRPMTAIELAEREEKERLREERQRQRVIEGTLDYGSFPS